MRELRTEIQISSNPDKVWEIIKDLPSWSKWNPIVNKIEGKFEVGAIYLLQCVMIRAMIVKVIKLLSQQLMRKNGLVSLAL